MQKTLKNFKINIPSAEEQEKITLFLSSLDNKIDLLNQNIKSLENYKKRLASENVYLEGVPVLLLVFII